MKKPELLSDKAGEASANGFKILAVTSCPTGIAHTYMAAEGEASGYDLQQKVKILKRI